jgi:hypothetical protein
MKLLYWMAAASEERQPLSITAKMRIAGFSAMGGKPRDFHSISLPRQKRLPTQ